MTTLSFSLSLISARFSQWRGVRKPVIRNLTSVPPFSSASLSATVGRILKKERTVPGVVADPGAFPRGKHGRPLLRPTLEITFLPEANVSRSSSRYAPVRSFVRSMPRAAAARAALWRLHKPRTIFWLPWERRVCTSVVRQREQREREREREDPDTDRGSTLVNHRASQRTRFFPSAVDPLPANFKVTSGSYFLPVKGRISYKLLLFSP